MAQAFFTVFIIQKIIYTFETVYIQWKIDKAEN